MSSNKHSTIVQYSDLKQIPVKENDEPLVEVSSPLIRCEYEKFDMVPILGDSFLLRKSVFEKLQIVAQNLQKSYPELYLRLVYAYRHPDVQREYFKKRKHVLKKEQPNSSEEELISKTHLFVASPDVAGHPTGGAVDVTLENKDGPIDMGTRIADFSDSKIETFAQGVTEHQNENRQLLRSFLMEQGFAPFNGEWWHFSYGDKEWAFYYDEPHALYSEIYCNQK